MYRNRKLSLFLLTLSEFCKLVGILLWSWTYKHVKLSIVHCRPTIKSVDICGGPYLVKFSLLVSSGLLASYSVCYKDTRRGSECERWRREGGRQDECLPGARRNVTARLLTCVMCTKLGRDEWPCGQSTLSLRQPPPTPTSLKCFAVWLSRQCCYHALH